MGSKCWFVLKQTHYPPPEIPTNGTGKLKGPICLGHIIPDLRHLDSVINRRDLLPIPPEMPIYSTKSWELAWKVNNADGIDLFANVRAPIAAAVGLTVQGDVGVAFERTVGKYWEFEALETAIIQPTAAYIEDSMETDEVVAYVKRQGPLRSSSSFMITGIIIAKGSKYEVSHSTAKGLGGGFQVGLQAVAEAGLGSYSTRTDSTSSSAERMTDFIWAVRLAKIGKGVLDRAWSHRTLSRGATFGLHVGDETDVVKTLRKEGLEDIQKDGIHPEMEDVFVIGDLK